MNILVVGPDMNEKGGMATVIKNFHDEYSGPNKLYFLASWKSNSKIGSFIKSWFSIRSIIRKQQISIVHVHVAERGSFVRASLLRKIIPKDVVVIFHMHAAEFDQFYNNAGVRMRKFIKHNLNQVDLIIALSNEWQIFYQGLTETRVMIVNNAVKTPATNQYDPNSSKVITVGRLGQRKGTFDLLKVAEQVQTKNADITFDLYGDTVGDDLERIQAVITSKQLHNVSVKGWLSDLQKVVQHAGIHFLPSYHEGVPMAILETMGAGVPNVATNVGGISEVINDGDNGYLDEPGDIDRMTTQILDLFGSESKRQQMSDTAFNTIKEKYSIDAYFAQWDQIYEELGKQW